MKKYLLWLMLSSFFVPLSYATLIVKPNLEWWVYHFPIEIYLNTNQKNAKVFYYTDGIGRQDTTKQYRDPILLKSNTDLEYYAVWEEFEDTVIGKSIYTFEYSNALELIIKDNTILIQNNSSEIQNIGYWHIEWLSLNYTISPNIFIEPKKYFSLDYHAKNGEKISLYAPDGGLKKSTLYTKTSPIQPQTLINIPTNTENNDTEDANLLWEQSEIWANLSPSLGSNQTQTWAVWLSEDQVFHLGENLTSDITQQREQSSKNIFLTFFLLLWSAVLFIISYNTYLYTYKKIWKK